MGSKYGAMAPQAPRNDVDRRRLYGFNPAMAEAYWDKHSGDHPKFFIAGQADPPPDTVRLWKPWAAVRGKEPPDLTPQPTGNCFVPETLVQMADGHQKAICDVQVGDLVLTHTGAEATVVRTPSREYVGWVQSLRDDASNEVTSTPEHEFIHCREHKLNGWREMQGLAAGSALFVPRSFGQKRDYVPTSCGSGFVAEITQKTETYYTGRVHCLEVDHADHSFIANGYAVHNCVAAGADDAIEVLQCTQIYLGKRAEFKPIYNPYHYATGRVLIGQNRLRGGAGSVGGWQAKALEQYGVIYLRDGLPAYNKKNVDAWGDDKKAEGQSFRDYMDEASERLVKTTSRVDSMGHLFEALGFLYPLTIASNTGYSMMPGNDGFHRVSGSWSHQMSIWGYSQSKGWIAIKNQWGDVHGQVKDPETGEPWPRGFICARIEEFERRHFRGSETIAYSDFVGFPARRYDHAAFG